jgi:hypothetical protein
VGISGMTSDGAFWVISGPGIPCGARLAPEAAEFLGPERKGTRWVDMCSMGQHLPQMYQAAEIHPLTRENCARLGLCEDCLGWGDTGPVPQGIGGLARSLDEVRTACPNCGGSGRPALRVVIRRTAATTAASISLLPHEYVPPLPGDDDELRAAFGESLDMCLACGASRGDGPHGEETPGDPGPG